jgi:hypothetical protein
MGALKSVVSFVGTGLLLVSIASASEMLEELKAKHNEYLKAWNLHDVHTLSGGIDEQAVGFWPDRRRPTDFARFDGKERERALERFFAGPEETSVTPINIQFRVVGDTGIVWGFYEVVTRPTGKKKKTETVRTIEVYVRDGGRWVLAGWHFSDPPSRNE